MKRLLLASSGLSYLKTFVNREPSEMKMLFIPTAGNLDKNIWWIDKDRDVLRQMGFTITELDIANSNTEEMKKQLETADIIYVAGGNTFYLLQQLQDSGFGELLKEYIAQGGLYAGASAGAIVAGPDIQPISSIDEPEKVEGLTSTQGLGLVSFVPIPHYDMTSRSKAIDEIKAKYQDAFEIVLMIDDEAIVVNGDEWKKVRSNRNELEHEWFAKNHEDVV